MELYKNKTIPAKRSCVNHCALAELCRIHSSVSLFEISKHENFEVALWNCNNSFDSYIFYTPLEKLKEGRF